MRRWLILLGGPLIWAAHFLAIYLTSSVSYVATGANSTAARIVIIGLSAVAVAAAAWLAVHAVRRPRNDIETSFWRTVTSAGAILALVAIIWQTLPVIASIEGTVLSALS
jgi:hypothetical protein